MNAGKEGRTWQQLLIKADIIKDKYEYVVNPENITQWVIPTH